MDSAFFFMGYISTLNMKRVKFDTSNFSIAHFLVFAQMGFWLYSTQLWNLRCGIICQPEASICLNQCNHKSLGRVIKNHVIGASTPFQEYPSTNANPLVAQVTRAARHLSHRNYPGINPYPWSIARMVGDGDWVFTIAKKKKRIHQPMANWTSKVILWPISTCPLRSVFFVPARLEW